MDVSVKYIELPPEGPTGGEEVIVIEHEPELQAEVPPPEADSTGASIPTNFLMIVVVSCYRM